MELYPSNSIALAGDIESIEAPNGQYTDNDCSMDRVDFLFQWTQLEVYAKLEKIPIIQIYKSFLSNKRHDRVLSLTVSKDYKIQSDIVGGFIVSVG